MQLVCAGRSPLPNLGEIPGNHAKYIFPNDSLGEQSRWHALHFIFKWDKEEEQVVLYCFEE